MLNLILTNFYPIIILSLLVSYFFRLNKNNIEYFYLLISILLILFIGMRFNNGGDWGGYYKAFEISKNISFINYIIGGDYIFYGIIKILSSLKLKLNSLFFLSAFLHFFAIYYLAKNSKNRKFNFFFLNILLIFFSSGYLRQSFAISIFILSFWFYHNNKRIYFLATNTLLLFIHKSSVLLIILAFYKVFEKFEIIKKYKFLILPLLSVLLLLFLIVILPGFIGLINAYTYSESVPVSNGFIFRYSVIILVTTFCIISLFISNKKPSIEYLMIILLVNVNLFLGYFFPTAADRLQYYIIYLVPLMIDKTEENINKNYFSYILFFLIFYVAIMNISWFYLSDHSIRWVNYTNLFLL